jgi:phosphoglycolate phosphatase-like HAD superfamily hydrolase
MKKILLFDIDGTIVRVGSTLTKLFDISEIGAIKEVYGIDITPKDIEPYHGFTDMKVITMVLKDKGLKEDEITRKIVDMFESFSQRFSQNIEKTEVDGVLLDGVAEVLNLLSKDEHYILGLLTGNIKAIAKMKLEKLGIWHYFKIGGFGDSSMVRSKLVDIALKEALDKKLIQKVDRKQVYVIGDTKNDILCAKEAGTLSVAVSTGHYSKEALEHYKPDYLLSNLKELISVISK